MTKQNSFRYIVLKYRSRYGPMIQNFSHANVFIYASNPWKSSGKLDYIPQNKHDDCSHKLVGKPKGKEMTAKEKEIKRVKPSRSAMLLHPESHHPSVLVKRKGFRVPYSIWPRSLHKQEVDNPNWQREPVILLILALHILWEIFRNHWASYSLSRVFVN